MVAAKKNANAIVRPARPAHNPGAFLDLPADVCDYENAAAVILPMPFEASVSYGGGTRNGPDAIIAASQQVELYDPFRDFDPALVYGVHTLPTLPVFADFSNGRAGKKPNAAAVIRAIAEAARKHLDKGKFVCGLGGEHTVSLGVARGVAESCGAFTLVHVDAHADLRDSYEGDRLSHASVVRRIAEIPECEGILQLGIRSTTGEQMDFVRAHAPKRGIEPIIRTWFARDMHRDKSWKREFRKAVTGRRVFFTFDVDGLDPSVIPATGTPEPSGLTWRQFMKIVKITGKYASRCLAMDCVELAPSPGLHYADFAAARAVYEMLSMFIR